MAVSRVLKRVRWTHFLKREFVRFFGYAVLEIILIVLGVLIAVQINNKVEAQKAKQTQINLLKDLSNALDFERIGTESTISSQEMRLDNAEKFLDILNGEESYSDSILNFVFNIGYAEIFKAKLGPYEELKNFGFHIITNEELRLGILNLYEHDFSILNKLSSQLEDEYHIHIFPRLIRHFELYKENLNNSYGGSGRTAAKLIDRDKLFNDQELKQYIILSYQRHKFIAQQAKVVEDIRMHYYNLLNYEIDFLETGINPKKTVSFSLAGYKDASNVSLAGAFNDWSQLKNPMKYKNGKWTIKIEVFPGTYEYKFIVDGVWMEDPGNDNKKYIPSINGYNSIIVVNN